MQAYYAQTQHHHLPVVVMHCGGYAQYLNAENEFAAPIYQEGTLMTDGGVAFQTPKKVDVGDQNGLGLNQDSPGEGAIEKVHQRLHRPELYNSHRYAH